MTREEQIVSLRSALDWLKDDVEVIEAEVDPVLEAGALHKAFDDGPVLLAENLKGYSHARMVMNFWGRQERMVKIMGLTDYSQAKLKLLDAIKHPIPPKEVKTAPCHEVFIPRNKSTPWLYSLWSNTRKLTAVAFLAMASSLSVARFAKRGPISLPSTA